MWKPFHDSQNVYMLRLDKTANNYNLYLTDLSCIWGSQISTVDLVTSFKENNPLIGATREQIVIDLLDIINNLQNVNILVKPEGLKMLLTFEKSCTDTDDSLKDQKITYKFILNKEDQDEFKNKITVSAIQTIYFLETQQKMLFNLVQKKDRELEEFRMEKGDISRVDLKTEKFDVNVLNTDKERLLLDVFTGEKSRDFWEKFTEKNGEVHTTNLQVELEPWNARPKRKVVHSGKQVVKKGSGIKFKKL